MPNARRSAAVAGVLLAFSAIIAPALLATSRSVLTSVQLTSHSPSQVAARFQGRLEPIALGQLEDGAVGLHDITVVSLYYRTSPDLTVFEGMAAAVSRFYGREVPGTQLAFTYASIYKVSRSVACQPKSALTFASLHTDVDPSRSHTHVVAWAPECSGAGYGWIRHGNGMMWVGGTNPQLLAHEFGHNLGLSHSNGLQCTDGSGKQVTLSANCSESAYDDPFSVMGNQCDLDATCRLVGPDIAALTGQAIAVSPRQVHTVTLATGGADVTRTAFIKTPRGVVYFDAAQGNRSPYQSAVPPGVQVRILTAVDDALLRVPDVVSGKGRDGSLELRPFDAWDIPGTGTRVIVTSAGNDSATLRFIPSTSTSLDLAPATPTITSAKHYPFNRPYPLAWTGVQRADLLGYVVSRTQNGRVTSYRVPAHRLQLTVPGVTTASGVALKVWAVSRLGVPSRPAALHVSTNPTFIRFTLSAKHLAPVSVDPLSPTFKVQVGDRGTLQWTVDADQATHIKGWNVHVALHDKTTIDIALPANARHWDLPAKVLASIRMTATFAAPYVVVDVVPRGLRFDAEVALYPER